MSDEEEEKFCYFGTPLEPYDEDAFPKRKPVSIEDQIATDAHGRRRFHGAFTGGFSAGFFNTAGSLEGWAPTEFKSSRQEKAQGLSQKPEDFMDDEDVGEFGIAPQRIKAKKEFSIEKKRSRQATSTGPIPGEPVLETLLTSGNETIGHLLLRNMGHADRVKKRQEVMAEARVYGCVMPTQNEIPEDIRSREYKIPEIYKTFLKNPKDNTFGLGYQGLQKPHVNLFQSSQLVVRDKNNKKFSIGGQAFGVGAFEDEDDDIYLKEDMSNYDFELTKEEKSTNENKSNTAGLLFEMFKKSPQLLKTRTVYPPPTIPHSFTGVHKMKKSRFEPIEEEKEEKPKERINPMIRAKYLGEEVPETYTQSTPSTSNQQRTKKSADKPKEEPEEDKRQFDILADRFVSSSRNEDVHNILESVNKTETLHGTEQMRDAVRMKMFGPLTRITTDWQPCSVLCKRFNVPEPFSDKPEGDRNKKRTKNLIFQTEQNADEEPALKPGISSRTEEDEPPPMKAEEENIPEIITIKEETIIQQDNSVVPKEDNTTTTTSEEDDIPVLVDVTEKIGVEEKVDLYKAVFLSSSESEEETEEENVEEKSDKKTEEYKSNILTDNLIPDVKPLREGILSNLDFSSFNKNRKTVEEANNKEENATNDEEIVILSPGIYGPQLPIKKERVSVTEIDTTKVYELESEDEWIEKGEVGKNKHKKTKKHKNHKHKKHKHKKTRKD